VLFANVAGDGTLLSGTATSVSHGGTGIYFINFGTDVSVCAGVATGGGSTVTPNLFMGFPNPNSVGILWKQFRSTPFADVYDTNAAFQLIVVC
jgi:hypothetical protein